jgi:phi13 family phage major tail protein
MASENNKVRFGASHVMYALYDEDQKKYGAWKPMAGAVQLQFEPQGSQSIFYADNVGYYTASPNSSDTGSIEIADMTEQAKIDLLGYIKDTTSGLTIEPSTAKHNPFAIGYQVEGDGNTLRGAKYNCTLNRPSQTHRTMTDSTDPDTLTLDYTCIGRDFDIDGEIVNVLGGFCTDGGEDHVAFDNFFKGVIVPGKTSVAG